MNRSIASFPIQRIENETSSPVQDWLAVEEPLEIRIGSRPVSITMRTPGHDRELACGFLFTEGILEKRASVEAVSTSANVVEMRFGEGELPELNRLQRHFFTTSSCGVCGKASLDAIGVAHCPALPRERPVLRRELIYELPDRLRAEQAAFERTGGLHAAGIFSSDGELLAVREDVGRHNAVDKLIGREWLAGTLPLHQRILAVSGRASFELVSKALAAGIPVMAAVGAPSSLAVSLAQRFGMTLAGFVRRDRFNIYSGEWRIQ